MFGKSKAAKKAKQLAQIELVNQTISETALTAATSEAIDPALIAVITAAIAASMGRSTNGIVIRSLRRATSALPAWGSTGRIEQISNGL
jgi:hypothetical protein